MPSRAFSQAYPDSPKPPPQTGQTQAVIQGGKAALDQRRQAATYDQTGQQQALKDLYGQMQQTGSGYSSHPAPTSAYAQWQQAQGFGAPAGPVSYGQTFPKSDYNGYKNEADMWGAASGTADLRRMEQSTQADALKQAMQAQLSQLDSQYAHQGAQPTGANIAALASLGGHQAVQGNSLGAQVHLGFGGAQDQMSQATAHAQDIAQVQGHKTGEYMGKLNDWYGQQAAPRVSGMETANQIQNTPLYEYQRQAAAQMGLDPALAAGRFPQSGMIADSANQRNIQSLQTTGLPYAEQQSTLHGMDTQAAADQKQATADQQLQMIDDIYGVTTIPGDKLASAANAPLDAVHQIVTDPAYQSYAQTVENNMAQAQQANPGNSTAAKDAIQAAVDEAIKAAVDDQSTVDPNTAAVLGRILHATYG